MPPASCIHIKLKNLNFVVNDGNNSTVGKALELVQR